MRLTSSIPPRRDGTLTARNDAGEAFVFTVQDGILICNVTDEVLVARLLARGDFMPVDAVPVRAAPRVEAMDDGNDPDEVDDAEEEGESALPIEALTAPVKRRYTRKAT